MQRRSGAARVSLGRCSGGARKAHRNQADRSTYTRVAPDSAAPCPPQESLEAMGGLQFAYPDVTGEEIELIEASGVAPTRPGLTSKRSASFARGVLPPSPRMRNPLGLAVPPIPKAATPVLTTGAASQGPPRGMGATPPGRWDLRRLHPSGAEAPRR